MGSGPAGGPGPLCSLTSIAINSMPDTGCCCQRADDDDDGCADYVDVGVDVDDDDKYEDGAAAADQRTYFRTCSTKIALPLHSRTLDKKFKQLTRSLNVRSGCRYVFVFFSFVHAVCFV